MAEGGIDRSAFLRRLGLIAGAALLVTVATWLALSRGFIFFGILHCIAVSSLVALPFLRLPLAVVLIAAAAFLALPFVASHAHLRRAAAAMARLGTHAPVANDYVPVFPWTGLALLGVAAGRRIAAAPPGWLAAAPDGPLVHVAEAGAGACRSTSSTSRSCWLSSGWRRRASRRPALPTRHARIPRLLPELLPSGRRRRRNLRPLLRLRRGRAPQGGALDAAAAQRAHGAPAAAGFGHHRDLREAGAVEFGSRARHPDLRARPDAPISLS